jgi:hypothetical protein
MQSNRARAVVGALLLAAAVVLFVVLSGGGDDSGSEKGKQPTAAGKGGPGNGAQSAKPKAPSVQTIAVKGTEPVGGVKKLEFTSGDRVRFRVTSDSQAEVHIHGYEITKPIATGGCVGFDFPANLEGGYEIELHHGGGETLIAELTVQPG